MEYGIDSHGGNTNMQSCLLQCKVYNRLKKFTDAVHKGLCCLEIAQRVGHEQVETEVTFELWRAWRSLHQELEAGVYKERCIKMSVTFAERYPHEAHSLLVSHDDEEQTFEMKVHFGIMQNAYHTNSQLEQAVWHGKICIHIAQEIGDKLTEVNACFTLTVTYVNLKQYDSAILYCEKCLEPENKQFIGTGELYKKLHLLINKLRAAKQETTPCFHFTQEMTMQNLLLQCRLFNKLKKYINVIETGTRCMEIALELQEVHVEIEAALELWRAFRLLRQEETAGMFYKEKCVEFVMHCVSDNPELEKAECKILEEDDAMHIEMKVNFVIMQNEVRKGKSHLEQAVWHGKRCLNIAQEIGDKLTELNTCLLLADICDPLKQFDEAMLYLERCTQINQMVGSKEEVNTRVHLMREKILSIQFNHFNALHIIIEAAGSDERVDPSICTIFYKRHQYDKAISLCEKCLKSNHATDAKAKTQLYFILQQSYARKGQYNLSIRYGSLAKETVQATSDKKTQTKIYLELALAYLGLDLYDEAIVNGKRCVEIANEDKSEHAMQAPFVRGNALFDSKLHESGIYVCFAAIAVGQLLNSKVMIFSAFTRLAGLLYSTGEKDMFFDCTKTLADIARELNDEDTQKYSDFILEISYCYMYNKLGQYEKAVSHNEKACELAEAINDRSFLTEAYLNKFRLHMLMNQIEEGHAMLTIAKRAAEELDEDNKYAVLLYIAAVSSTTKKLQQMKIRAQEELKLSTLIERAKDDFTYYFSSFEEEAQILSILRLLRPNELTQHVGIESSDCFNQKYVKKRFSHLLFFLADERCLDSLKLAIQLSIAVFIDLFKSNFVDLIMHQASSAANQYLQNMEKLNHKATEMSRKVETEQRLFKRQPEIKGHLYSLTGMLYFISMRSELAENNLKNAIDCFENVFETFHKDTNQLSIVKGYVLTYKLLSKIQVQMGNKEEAILALDRCRAKVLRYQLTKKHQTTGNNTKEATLRELTFLVAENKFAILFYSWFFNNLYIFCMHNTKGDNGENMIDVDCHYQQLNSERKKALGLEPATQNSLTNVTNMEEDQESSDVTRHHEYCCRATRGEPTEGDDDSYEEPCLRNQDGERTLFEKLHEMLISPFLSKITAEEIIIIPEDKLYSVPFSVLQDPRTNRYLSQDKRLRFSPSITNLLIHQDVCQDYYANSGSLIIGNPIVEGIQGLEPLPGSEEEAKTIAQIIGGVTPLLGSAATKSAVLSRLSEVCIIHFACHIILSESAIALSPEGDDTHLLKPEEVMEKEVHARLVVLSGCDSGLGKFSAEGVEGIARAFLAAGAAAVLVSLWRVDDLSTCEFMTTFYSYLLDWDVRRGASESLHRTIHDMRRKYEHEPKKWSGFYLMGDDVTIDRERLSVVPRRDSPPACRRRREPCETDE